LGFTFAGSKHLNGMSSHTTDLCLCEIFLLKENSGVVLSYPDYYYYYTTAVFSFVQLAAFGIVYM